MEDKMPKLTFLGQSGWHIESSGTNIVIDPFLEGNPLAKHKASDIKADYIILSHAHGDHIGDAEPIAKANKSTIISNFEIANYYGAKDIENHPLHIGGGWNFPFGRVKLTQAFHGSSFPDGSYGGMPAGILLTLNGLTIYHTGDTALFSDMQLIGKAGVDVMLVCIGDNFTMGIDDAVEAVSFVKPKLTIPMHYKTFGFIDVDPTKFEQKCGEHGFKVKLLEVADSVEV
jgi:L-ascorbate metabolism protein UlaG (beta-lactamase superfamily)